MSKSYVLYTTTGTATSNPTPPTIRLQDLPPNMKLSEAIKLFEKLGYKLKIEFTPKEGKK